MGHRTRSQRKGSSGVYKAPSHRYKYKIRYPKAGKTIHGKVIDIIFDCARTAPLAKVKFEDGMKGYILAPESITIGERICIGENAPVRIGNTLPLKNLPEGTLLHNIEVAPGDGGKLIRSSGSFATLVSKKEGECIVQLPSGVMKTFKSKCRATVGIVAGGGRKEKPFVKAGKKYHAYRSKAGPFFRVSGVAMNVVDHPFGGGGHQHIGRPSTVSRGTPPGRKVGLISAKRTGKRR
ncbi:MAG: 50S ribosomal protein L2 [Methanomicrobia archaeon]|nr:50S ribosomal protein L2 [Methanomicrobia archaeon]RLF95813.1 MAG: 50S ribosomal protein L2 [Thermococci archaeon]RLF97008.1 MAG: 50S ribosomal protein L2 [Thermococci archaeon]